MNIWLLGLGVVGIAATGVWYAVLLGDRSPARHVPFLSRGEIPTRTLYLWVLTVLLSESFVVNAFDGVRGGFSVIGGVAVAFLLSEIARWWHNRTVPAASAEAPTERSTGRGPTDDRVDGPDGP